MNTLLNYVLYFFAYSAIGWFIESFYCSVGNRKLTNRGFLKGPMCPIYGTGALVLSITLEPIANAGNTLCEWNIFKNYNPIVITSTFWAVILVGMIVADIVEFLTSLIMEKLFHARWWDYTDYRFNIQGRICLRHTMYWGIMAFVYTYAVHPFMKNYVFHFITDNTTVRNVTLIIIFVIFISDVIASVIAAADVSKFIDKINDLSDTVSILSSGLKTNIELKYEEIQQNFSSQTHKIKEQFGEIKTYFERSDDVTKKERKKVQNARRIFESTGTISKQINKRIDAIEKWLNELKNDK